MANEQHLEWLREGVEAWNARREQDDFIPDLSGERIQLQNFQNSDLRSAQLERAQLHIPDLRGADLRGAKLEHANLHIPDLRSPDLSCAKLRGADLGGAKTKGTNFIEADVRTIYLTEHENEFGDLGIAKYTNLQTQWLNQQQLNSMIGDSGTIIPDHLTRPAHWPEFEVPDEGDNETDKSPNTRQGTIESKAATSDQVAYYQHLALKLVASPIKSSSVLTAYGSQLIEACRMYRQFSSENDLPNDLILTESIGEQFLNLAKVIEQSIDTQKSDDKKYIEILEQRIKELEKMVHTLIADKQSTQPSAKQTIKTAYLKSVGVALGTGTVAVLLGGVTYIFDPSWQDAANLIDSLSKLFRQPPPPPPSMSV